MTTLLHIERQAWLVSVALHTVIALGFVGLTRNLVIDATEPFRLELVLVDKEATVPTVVETLAESAPMHRDSSNRRMEVPKDIVHTPIRVRTPRPVITTKIIEPELQEQPSLKNPENTVGVDTESEEPVVEQLQPMEPERFSSVPVVTQSSAVTLPQVTHDEAEIRAESNLTQPNINSNVVPDSYDEKDKEVPAITNRDLESDIPPSSVPAQSAALTDAGQNQSPTAHDDSPPQSVKATRPDYSWLTRLLWERIDRTKRYADDALENEWEGRVVMLVTIREDGRIDDVSVAESSGNRSLDREAAKLITQVSPLSLDRPLGANRVKVRVPISFGLKKEHPFSR